MRPYVLYGVKYIDLVSLAPFQVPRQVPVCPAPVCAYVCVLCVCVSHAVCSHGVCPVGLWLQTASWAERRPAKPCIVNSMLFTLACRAGSGTRMCTRTHTRTQPALPWGVLAAAGNLKALKATYDADGTAQLDALEDINIAVSYVLWVLIPARCCSGTCLSRLAELPRYQLACMDSNSGTFV